MPGNLAWYLIRDAVEGAPELARLQGFQLLSKQGFPVIQEARQAQAVPPFVTGYLVHLRERSRASTLATLNRYEGVQSGFFVQKLVSVTLRDGTVAPSLTYAGTEGMRPDFEPMQLPAWTPWRSIHDPLLVNGVAACRQMFDELPAPSPAPDTLQDFWVPMMRIQGVFLALCSVLERLALLREGEDRRTTASVKDLSKDLQFDQAFKDVKRRGQIPNSKVINMQYGDEQFPGNCRGALTYWYAVRSNLVHRGKDSWRDARLLHQATAGLIATLERYLELNATDS